MKKVNIPQLNCTFRIYRPDERQKFHKRHNLQCDDNEDALSCENTIWIGRYDRGLVVHECVHFVDWVLEEWLDMKQDTLRSNTELRAYLTQWAYDEAIKYLFPKDKPIETESK